MPLTFPIVSIFHGLGLLVQSLAHSPLILTFSVVFLFAWILSIILISVSSGDSDPDGYHGPLDEENQLLLSDIDTDIDLEEAQGVSVEELLAMHREYAMERYFEKIGSMRTYFDVGSRQGGYDVFERGECEPEQGCTNNTLVEMVPDRPTPPSYN